MNRKLTALAVGAVAVLCVGLGRASAGPGTEALTYHAPSPVRAFDSRPTNIPTRPGAAATICGPQNARALAANLTVDQPKASGYLTAYPGNEVPSGTSALNFVAGQVVANSGIFATDTNGCFKITTTAETFIIVDITGYFSV